VGTNYLSQSRHRSFSELVAFLLTSEGVEAAYLPRARHRISDSFAEGDAKRQPRPDVDLAGFYIMTTTSQPYERLGATFDAARSDAALAGEGRLPVVISHRPRGRSAFDALVVTDLRTFTAMVEQIHDRPEVAS
jgi:hypothetical protein